LNLRRVGLECDSSRCSTWPTSSRLANAAARTVPVAPGTALPARRRGRIALTPRRDEPTKVAAETGHARVKPRERDEDRREANNAIEPTSPTTKRNQPSAHRPSERRVAHDSSVAPVASRRAAPTPHSSVVPRRDLSRRGRRGRERGTSDLEGHIEWETRDRWKRNPIVAAACQICGIAFMIDLAETSSERDPTSVGIMRKAGGILGEWRIRGEIPRRLRNRRR
jgi:hypothetical protein